MAPRVPSPSPWRPPQVTLDRCASLGVSDVWNLQLHLLPSSGVISVYFEANVSSNKPQGFNASFWVRKCHHSSEEGEPGSPECPSGSQCRGGICQCPRGYGGPHCDRPVCPQGCGVTEGRGTCNTVRSGSIWIWTIVIYGGSSSNKLSCVLSNGRNFLMNSSVIVSCCQSIF